MPIGENKEWTIVGKIEFPSITLTDKDEELKAEREKVWEMAEHILRIPYTERLKYFGTSQVFDIVSMPVDRALDMYESWKKDNSAEELIKSLKPQDVVYFESHLREGSVGMVTYVTDLDNGDIEFALVHSDGGVDVLYLDEDIEHIEKIGRVVETADILGEIKKIEDEWRKNR